MTDNNLTLLLIYLDSTQAKLLAELNIQNLNMYPVDGGWSADQVLAHLIKTEKYLYPLFSFISETSAQNLRFRRSMGEA